MAQALSVVVASCGRKPFELLADVVRRSGHHPVAYVVSRSMRPATPSEPEFVDAIAEVVRSIPDGMDLLLPGRSSGLAKQLLGYHPDLMIVFGFNWKLPPEVLSIHGSECSTSIRRCCRSIVDPHRCSGPSTTAIRTSA
jgi:methionyl-tRNA formyltransferase